MKRGWILLMLLFVTGCATPVTVKQAIKKQSEAYVELQGALRDFTHNYVALNEQLFRLDQEAQARMEAMSMVRGLAGDDISAVAPKTWAAQHLREINLLAKELDTTSPRHKQILEVFDQSTRDLEKAFPYGHEQSQQELQKIRADLQQVQKASENVIREIRALMVAHEAVADYLEIDLSPDSATLKEAIANIKVLRK